MSEGGKGNRDAHSTVFRVAPVGAWSLADATALATGVAGILAAVLFNRTHFMRAGFSELASNGRVVPNSGATVPLSVVGANAFTVGDGPARDQVCLALEKSATNGRRSGVSLLRHCLSAVEEAAYLNAGTVPARFGSLPAGGPGAGSQLGAALLAEFAAHNFELKMPPRVSGLITTSRVVNAIAAQDFRLVQVTKRRIPVQAAEAAAIQRQLNQWARQARRLYDRALAAGNVAGVAAAITALAADAAAAYAALPAAEAIYVLMPAFPALI